jgi:pSer/pThr/pTyr-binding forkhead associated (FHA) protein
MVRGAFQPAFLQPSLHSAGVRPLWVIRPRPTQAEENVMAKVLTLTPISGTQLDRSISVETRTAIVGSSPRSDIVLADRAVEARHAEFRQMFDRWFIVPLTASGGIVLNGVPVTGQSRLNPGDLLTIGRGTYRVQMVDMQEQEAGAPARRSGVPQLGEYFLRRGIMNSEQLGRVAQRQAELQKSGTYVVFGQMAFEMGYVNRSQLEAALAEQREDFNERFRG